MSQHQPASDSRLSAASAVAAPSSSASLAHGPLDRLREVAWQAAGDKTHAKEAVLVAFAHATSQLPGSQPELLGVAPAVFVLLPGNLQRACPAGVLLMQVCVPASAFPGSCTSDGGSNVQCCSTERSANDHMLRVLVYCPDTGALLERRDWLLRDESKLAQHSTFGLPCWDSREGWQLLFPEPLDEPHQAAMFTTAIATFGAEQPPPLGTPRFPVLPPASHSPSFSRSCDSYQPPAAQHAQKPADPEMLEMPSFSLEEAGLLAEVLTAGSPVSPAEELLPLPAPAEQHAAEQPPARQPAKRKQAAAPGKQGGAPLRSVLCHHLGAPQQQQQEQQQQQRRRRQQAALQLELSQPLEQPAADEPYHMAELDQLPPPLKLPRRAFTPPAPRLAEPQRLQQQCPAFTAPPRLQLASACGLGSAAFDSWGSSRVPAAGQLGSQQLPSMGGSCLMASANLSSSLRHSALTAFELPPRPSGPPPFAGWASAGASCSLPAAAAAAPAALTPAQPGAACMPQQPAERCSLELAVGNVGGMHGPPASPFAAAAQLPAFPPLPSHGTAAHTVDTGPDESGWLAVGPAAPLAAQRAQRTQRQPVPMEAVLEASLGEGAAFGELCCASHGPVPAAPTAGGPAAAHAQPLVSTACLPASRPPHGRLHALPAAVAQEHNAACCSPGPAQRASATHKSATETVDEALVQLLDWEDELDSCYRRAVVTLRNRAVSTAARFRR